MCIYCLRQLGLNQSSWRSICGHELQQRLMPCYLDFSFPNLFSTPRLNRTSRSHTYYCLLNHRQLVNSSIGKRIGEFVVYMPAVPFNPLPRYLMVAGEFV